MAIPAPANTDEGIQRQVVNELKWNAEVPASEVPDFQRREAAARVAWSARGVTQVDHTTVRPRPDGRTMREHSESAATAAKRCAAAILLAVGTVAAGACGGDEAPKPANINETGVDTVVGNLRILAVHVPAPDGDRYASGADLRVILTIANDGTTTDVLTRATVPDAERTAIRWDRNCDGTLETLDRLPLAPAGGTGPEEPAAADPDDPYDVMAFSVRHDVLAGTSIGLILTFQHAGRIVTTAYVQPKSANIVEPVRRCATRTPRSPDG